MWSRFVYLLLLGLSLCCVLSAQMKLTIQPSEVPDVSLAQYSPSAHPAFGGFLDDNQVAPSKGAALVVTNSTNRTIVGISVIWDYADASGKLSHRAVKSDSFLTNDKRPVLQPGGQLLLTPTTMITDVAAKSGSYSTLVSGQSQQNDLVNTSSSITGHLDLVIFEDGEIVGRDQRNYIDELKSRKKAAETLLRELREANGHEAAVAVLAKEGSLRPQNAEEAWRLRYARRLRGAPDIERAIQALSQLLELPQFYRK